jgi:hypothetical protein
LQDHIISGYSTAMLLTILYYGYASCAPHIQVPFLCFALSNPFWAVPRALCFVFIFCASEIVLDSTKVPGQVFMFYALGSILDGIKGAGSGTMTSRTVQVCCLRCGLVGSFSPTNKLGLIIEKIYIKCPNTVARCP